MSRQQRRQFERQLRKLIRTAGNLCALIDKYQASREV